MCFFERDSNIKSNPRNVVYDNPNKVLKYSCGVCPECLAKKARYWALRCGAESQVRKGIMITLTYDDYLYNNGRIVGEKTPNKDLKCNVEHCQLFMKRLRKWVVDSRKKKKFPLYKARPRFEEKADKIVKRLPREERAKAKKKYVERKLDNLRRRNKRIEEYNKQVDQKANVSFLLTAEHGKRTNRSHYHSILFGVDFKDRVPYKKSDRGNMIYKSKTLTNLWGHGICTIDAVNITGQIARYCTKYCAKDSCCDDTFMLMSRGIGDEWLLKNFNGKSYILDGREYPIPKLIWNRYIQEKIDEGFNGKRTYLVDGVSYPIPQIAVNRAICLVDDTWRNEPLLHFQEKRKKLRKTVLKMFDSPTISYKYISWRTFHDKYEFHLASYLNELSRISRQMFSKIKNENPLYKAYLQYWQKKAELYELNRPSDFERIQALKDDKYFFYKQKAIRAKIKQEIFGKCVIPRSGESSVIKYKLWNFAPTPLVIKAQMTPKKANNFIKQVYWSKHLQDFIYLRPVKE